jgi:F420-dependent oxidoreductase-like protein
MQFSVVSDLAVRGVDFCVEDARGAERAGVDGYWVPGGGRDALLLATMAGREVPRLHVGPAIVSLWHMQPVALAEEALTANDALKGRLTLGLGISHSHRVAQRYGLKLERPIRYLREYLSVLMQGLEKQKIDFQGELFSAHCELILTGMARPKVLIAALGPQAVRVAGSLADGTLTFMVPLKSLAEITVPVASRAAADAGRQRPYFCAQVPVCLTIEEARVRDEVAAKFDAYLSGGYAAYQNAFRRDGQNLGPRDVAIVGDEAALRHEFARYRDAGIDEISASVFGNAAEKARTRAFLGELAKSRAV